MMQVASSSFGYEKKKRGMVQSRLVKDCWENQARVQIANWKSKKKTRKNKWKRKIKEGEGEPPGQ